MAEIIGGIGISHTPSMGMAFDAGMRDGFAPEWQPWYEGTRAVKGWLADARPDQIVVIYNDHLNHFEFDAYPTLAIGVSNSFRQADEGWGPRAFPDLPGDSDFGWFVTERLVHGGFDMTVCQDLAVDHGIYSWLPYLADTPWPAPILPIAVNMVRHPLPTSQRLWQLGNALGEAVRAYEPDQRIVVIATGGMSHQISGGRFGMANEGLDRFFLAHLQDDAARLLAIPQRELMRLGGTEAAELSIWFAMRAALSSTVREVHRFHTFPKITGCGVIVFEEPPVVTDAIAVGGR
ncbi:protocatechuate 3,4-dioxygenase [Sphingomonas sp. CGMCC 1.13654]|uniref:Protocatechuate 3,4-dioxygenase n=1 Tax=Sphingomonas chungangi TaxID=2683589 RepID=A0A838L5U3_9SPHN|nr:class III extradiol dioxygenase family protein [Sphingomonas chungangi]MBA2933972.1 protocatechuate 3,4-dioxygenase [Sphingomonas chungangi]